MYEREIEKIISKLDIMKQAYDMIRLVDPVLRRILILKDNQLVATEIPCFGIWEKGSECDNCISMRAYRERDTFIKVDYSRNEIYMMTAIPIEISDRLIVVELLKKATKSIIFNSDKQELGADIRSVIDGLNDIAVKDSLTGIYNRRYINERLPMDIINNELSGFSMAVIMADLDLFKNVNDTYGHLAGDCTLINFAQILQQGLRRANDWVARYGGEEFLICMPGANLRVAIETAENMRRALEERVMECGDFKFKITASFGVTAAVPEKGTTMEKLIEQADQKLYEAKRGGRNRVVG